MAGKKGVGGIIGIPNSHQARRVSPQRPLRTWEPHAERRFEITIIAGIDRARNGGYRHICKLSGCYDITPVAHHGETPPGQLAAALEFSAALEWEVGNPANVQR